MDMKNLNRWMLTLLLCTICLGSSLGQSYTIRRPLSTQDASGAFRNKIHGVKFYSRNGSAYKVTIDVVTVPNLFITWYANCFFTPINIRFHNAPLTMYKTSVDEQSADDPAQNRYLHDYQGPDEEYFYRSIRVTNNFCRKSDKPDSKNFFRYQALANQYIISPPFLDQDVNVNITLTLEGDITLSDIEAIKIPGVSELDALDFIKNQLPATHACADQSNTSEHCKAVRAIDSKQLPNGDVFVAAHRGLWGDQAETSIGAVVAAVDAKWNLIEVDILKTKDNIMLLMHDQQINRLSEIGLDSDPTREYAKGSSEETTSNKTWLSQLNYNAQTTEVPTMSNSTRTIPALKDLILVNKWGERVAGTDPNLTNFRDAEELFARLQNWDAVIALDTKDKDQNDYLYVTEQLLRMGIRYGVLDKLMFKPGSGVAGLEYQLFENHLTGKTELKDGVQVSLLDAFRNKVSVALILYANLFDNTSPTPKNFGSYMAPWLSMPSLSVVETQYKTGSDYFLVPNATLENKTPVQWLKDLDFRTGTFWDNAIDCRGTSDGRGHWFMPDENSGANVDFRGDLEWVINQKPGLLVTDRPDATAEYLSLFNLNAPLNKKP
jgi:Glycerophosphoryl diester phosphodiesterase family